MNTKEIYGQTQPMKILLTTPAVNARSGGIAIIISWCNHLKSIYGHEVDLFTESTETKCTWRRLDVPVVTKFKQKYYDVVIICSPHSIWIEEIVTTEKVFVFCQMAENLFHPDDERWRSLCFRFYRSPNPMFSISKWNIELFESLGRFAETYYIGNGIDFNDFPIERPDRNWKIILLESPDTKNPSKDPDHLALKLAGELKGMGYKIIAYGAKPLLNLRKNVDHYVINPDLATINKLYSEATIMIKATKYDARSLSPLEAMTKGCVVSRAINEGDDDLIDSYNCLKTDYNYEHLKAQTLELLNNQELITTLKENAYKYISEQTWINHLEPVNKIITA